MTTPKVSTVKKGGSRFYVHPTSRLQVPGVTSVVGMLPKDFLKFWAAKMTAEAAVDNIGAVVQMAVNGDRDGAVDYLKRAHMRSVGKSADIGTDVHDLVERISRGETVARVHPDLQVFVDHFNEYMADFQPEYLHLEETVWSEKYGYAGSFDAIAKIHGETIIIDNKTTKSGVHGEVAIQMAAYANADYIIDADGEQKPIPKLDGAAVLHLRPEGWQLVPVSITDEVFEVFLSLMKVHKWDKDLSKGVLGRPLTKESVKK
jgi:hypothetical protein